MYEAIAKLLSQMKLQENFKFRNVGYENCI